MVWKWFLLPSVLRASYCLLQLHTVSSYCVPSAMAGLLHTLFPWAGLTAVILLVSKAILGGLPGIPSPNAHTTPRDGNYLDFVNEDSGSRR